MTDEESIRIVNQFHSLCKENQYTQEAIEFAVVQNGFPFGDDFWEGQGKDIAQFLLKEIKLWQTECGL